LKSSRSKTQGRTERVGYGREHPGIFHPQSGGVSRQTIEGPQNWTEPGRECVGRATLKKKEPGLDTQTAPIASIPHWGAAVTGKKKGGADSAGRQNTLEPRFSYDETERGNTERKKKKTVNSPQRRGVEKTKQVKSPRTVPGAHLSIGQNGV